MRSQWIALLVAWTALPAWSAVRVEILRGDGANNNAVQGVGVSPAVRVLDASGQPVRGVLVIFTAPETGPSVAFGNEGNTAHGITDETGVVIAPRARPVGGNGPLEIRVMANQGGEFVNATIRQMNLGIGPAGGRPLELHVVKVPEPEATAPQSPRSLLRIRVRVEDGTGRPVPMATVSFFLRKLGSGGKVEEVAHDVTSSGPDGEAIESTPRRSGNQRWQFMVRAEASGRRSTGYFTVE